MTTQVDVFISGAGPVGLYFAYQMALRGHTIYCVDPKPGPTEQSRAVLVTSRTMEIFESVGVAEEILFESYLASGIRIHRNKTNVSTLNASGDTKFAHLSLLPQGKVESILFDRLSASNHTVHWETELVSYVQHKDHVVSTVRNIQSGQETVVESKFIIGADGSHSRVRKEDKTWKYDGIAVQTQFILADLTFKHMPIKFDKANAFSQGSDALGIIPLNPEIDKTKDRVMYRIITNLETYSVKEDTEERITHGFEESAPTQELVQIQLNQKAAPYNLEIKEVVWSSFFKINERMANGYRRDRAFLVGDAAHCHSPAGGQGMNVGIQDADNLAWKISSVLRGISAEPDKLLDSYTIEREPHARKILKNTSTGTKYGTTNTSVADIVRASVLSVVLSIPSLNRYSFQGLTQQQASIEPSVKSEVLGTSDKGLIQPGTYLPPMGTLRKSYATEYSPGMLQSKTLHEILSQNRNYTVILVSTSYSNYYPHDDLIQQFWTNTRGYPIRRLVIRSSWHVNQMKYLPEFIPEEEASIAKDSFYSELNMENSDSVTKKIGLEQFFSNRFLTPSNDQIQPKALLFIRPDLFVASSKIIHNEQQLDEAIKYLDTLFLLG